MNGILMKPFLRKAVEIGTKTQTRRLQEPKLKIGEVLFIREEVYVYGQWVCEGTTSTGQPKYRFEIESDDVEYSDDQPKDLLGHRETGKLGWAKRSPLHCRAQDARTFIEVTALRKENLSQITEKGALAEGIEPIYSEELLKRRPEFKSNGNGWTNYMWHGRHDIPYWTWSYQYSSYKDPIGSFMSLWASINGAESVANDPIVHVIEFKKVPKPI